MTAKQKIKAAKDDHAKYCNCRPVWRVISTGRALACAKTKALIYWPTVTTRGLSTAQELRLFCSLPMSMGSDGDTANEYLLLLGFKTVNKKNYAQAYSALRKRLESDLWKDHIRMDHD